jgi:hypothetical protein
MFIASKVDLSFKLRQERNVMQRTCRSYGATACAPGRGYKHLVPTELLEALRLCRTEVKIKAFDSRLWTPDS